MVTFILMVRLLTRIEGTTPQSEYHVKRRNKTEEEDLC